MVVTGLDRLVETGFARLKGQRIGVLCNQASVDRKLDHILDLLRPLHRSGFLRVQAVFGPQHGLGGHTQDNMIEWEGASDGRGWRVHSLYGKHREPTEEMLAGVELLVVDLQDVGARYYTFIWTMALCLRACARAGIPVLVLDRPNPIGGIQVEGPVMEPEFASFVGLLPLPARHGMTVGEIARYVGGAEVVAMQGWQREMFFDNTGLPWVMPSPNMPTLDTALVYPGGCLIEGTNLSEGRGTTRPFEMIGAPYLDGPRFCSELQAIGLPGVKFRPIEFEPTFNKHAGKLCQGCFVHVLDRRSFEPVLTYMAIIRAAVSATQPRSSLTIQSEEEGFRWKEPPYEYEYEKRPIDLLMGNGWLASEVVGEIALSDVRARIVAEAEGFLARRNAALLY